MAGCSSGRPTPDWTLKSFNHLEDYKKNCLEGNTRIADLHFNRALDEIKKSGDLGILARAYLIRMGIEVAVLEKVRDDDFLKVDAVEPNPVNKNFHAFLTGHLNRVQEQLLPEQYYGVMKPLSRGKTEELGNELEKIEDPLSRLIAIGVCVGQGRIDEGLLNTAIATASRNGWKKALLVYLEKLQVYYTEQGQQDKARTIKDRIQLISP
jgi:hypothetical protein